MAYLQRFDAAMLCECFGSCTPRWTAIGVSSGHLQCGRRDTQLDRNLRLHVLPRLGSVQLRRIDAGMLNTLYAALLADGRKDHAGGRLSPRSVRYIHTIIHRALKAAVRWGRLPRNPADAADPPKTAEAGRPESITWTADQLRTFLEGTRGSRHWPAYLLLATTGLRRGECLGLRWSDLDLDGARASIRQTVIAVKHTAMLGTPKTAKVGVRSPLTLGRSRRCGNTANGRLPSGY